MRMRIGVTLYVQNYADWNRYEAKEHGQDAPALDPTTDAKIWQEEIEFGLQVEDLGFDSLWTIEHHVTPYTMVTNALQLLTFFAGATSRIDLGTMVVVLPWHHPIRVAEDIIMLQHAMRGRTPYIGFGRGAARREFLQLGVDMNESRERFDESIEIVKLALTQEEFSYEGDIYNFKDITVRPRPRDSRQLIDNFHFSWGSPQSAPIGARHGLKPMIIPQKAFADYHADMEAFGRVRAQIGLPPARPRIHMNVMCAETAEQAKELATKYIPQYVDSAAREYELGSDHFARIKGYEHYAAQAGVMPSREVLTQHMANTYISNHVWGTPQQCLEKLQTLCDAFHPEEFMLVFKYGSMPLDVAQDSLQLFAREVLPAAHAIPLKEPFTYTDGVTAGQSGRASSYGRD
jgi:alkanesulfonate monooxygenase SsuD/methylene tetrahydromethanopterin reductase-like flavin-dependent oxidoreductase (luciferase family)